MKKFLIFSAILCMGLALAACSSKGSKGDSDSKEISPTTTKFNVGNLSSYVEVTDDDAKLVKDNANYKLHVKLKLVKEVPADIKEMLNSDDCDITCFINLVDDSGNKLMGDENLIDDEVLISLLKDKEVGQTVDAEFYVADFGDAVEKAVKFTPNEVSVEAPENTSDSDSSVSSDDESDDTDDVTADESTGSSNWDEVLDEYEEYTDKYISLLKRSANGDLSVVSEYQEMMEKAQSLGNKLSNAQGTMTPAQIARYEKILKKYSDAASDM